VGVAGWASIEFGQSEAADKGIGFFVVGELESHAIGVIGTATEAIVFLHADVRGVVAVACGFLRHILKSIKPRRKLISTMRKHPLESGRGWFYHY
jgi:hypothetical protein